MDAPVLSNVRNSSNDSNSSEITATPINITSSASTRAATVQHKYPWETNRTIQHRLDTAGPRVEWGRTYTLPSLPVEDYRVSNLQQFHERYECLDDIAMVRRRQRQQLSQTTSNSTTITTKTFLSVQPFYFYNPSIIPIPNNNQRYIQFVTTTRKPSYFVTFRLSTTNGCDIPYTGYKNKTKNLLGLAVLDEQLDIVPNSDVIIDVVSELPKYTNIPEDVHTFDDFRLITFGGQIFLTHRYFLLRLHISTPGATVTATATATAPTTRSSQNRNISQTNQQLLNEKSVVLQNSFGNGLTVKVLGLPNKYWVSGLGKYGFEYDSGKNFGWLPSLQGGDINAKNKIYLQRDIQGPREVLEVDIPRRRIISKLHMKDSSYVPEPSFRNEHEDLLTRFFYPSDRGTACCVKISNARHYHNVTSNATVLGMDHLWVGVSHTKNRKKDKMGGTFYYISRLYALSPTYELVARSGHLCFGFPTTDEHGDNAAEIGGVGRGDPLTNMTYRSRVRFRETEYNCPRIEFVTGISEKVDDPDSLLLGYGVNDCVARIVEVKKEQIARRLFGYVE